MAAEALLNNNKMKKIFLISALVLLFNLNDCVAQLKSDGSSMTSDMASGTYSDTTGFFITFKGDTTWMFGDGALSDYSLLYRDSSLRYNTTFTRKSIECKKVKWVVFGKRN